MPRLRLRPWCMLLFCLALVNVSWAQDSLPPSLDWKSSLSHQISQTGKVVLFRVAGSNTIGAHLGPKLVETFFSHEGLSDIRVDSTGENAVEVSGVWSSAERPVRLAVSIQAHGSSTGFQGLIDKTADLAAASRPIKDSEVRALQALGDMQDSDHEHIVAIDGLAIIVNPANPVQTLSTRQIQDLFTGKVQNWRNVGGAYANVNIYARDNKSGTFDTFERLVLQEQTLSSRARRFESNDQLAQSVLADPAGIGFVPLAAIGKAHALLVSDGVAAALAPSVLTVATEDYPLSRRLFFYSAGADTRAPALSAFLHFVASNQGQQVVGEIGFVAQALHPVDATSSDSRLSGWRRLNLNIRFADGTSDLDNKAQADVKRLSTYLNQPGNQKRVLTLVGYSNPVSQVEQASVSRLRAQNVRWALRQMQVRSDVETLAGEAMAVADPHSVNADRNRRVEVWIR